MKYYKDENNNPFVFEDNVTVEIIIKVEKTHNTTLTEITKADYEDMIAPTFEQLQTKKINGLKLAYDVSSQQDIKYMDTIFQADKISQELIASNLSVGSVPDNFYWKDLDNNDVPMTYEDLQGLAAVIQARGLANFSKYQDLKEQVNTATTIEEVETIAWEN